RSKLGGRAKCRQHDGEYLDADPPAPDPSLPDPSMGVSGPVYRVRERRRGGATTHDVTTCSSWISTDVDDSRMNQSSPSAPLSCGSTHHRTCQVVVAVIW